MTQPLDRTCRLAAKGAIDREAGEFWAENSFDMPLKRQNLSAFERNKVYLSRQGQQFIDLSFASGADLDADSRSVVVADFDRDGDPDLLIGSVGGGPLRLFFNEIPTPSHRLRMNLIGVTSNRASVGARVVARCGHRKIVRDLFPSNGFMGQSPAELILGVGSAEFIDDLEIRWPTGRVQHFHDAPTGCRVTIVEGENRWHVDDASPRHD